MHKKLLGVWVVIFLAAIGYFAFTYSGLPEKVASHFDLAGHPNGFQTKDGYLAFFITMVLFVNGLFSAMYIGIERIPTQLINIPWKAYWLSKPELKSTFFGKIRMFLSLLGIYVNIVFLFTVQVIYQQNVPNPFLTIPLNGGVALILVSAIFFVGLIFVITRPPLSQER